METNDKLLKDFFSENKKQIVDNGFTKRVIRKLPEQSDRAWIIWVFAAFGVALTFYIGLQTGLFEQIIFLLKKVPFYYLLAGVFCFPLLGIAGCYLSQNKACRII